MLRILGRFVDALYVSLQFDLPRHVVRYLDALKESAKESGDDVYPVVDNIRGVPGGPWWIRPYGRGKSQYVLENAAFYVTFSTWANLPACQLQFKAATLYEYGEDEYSTIVESFIRFWIGPELSYQEKVSRVDLAVDLQDDDFQLPDMGDVITRARSRVVHYDRQSPTAITLGKYGQALQSQIYQKSEELLVSDKAWMREVWRASGEYREDLPVWRVELRFFREGLKGFELDGIDDVIGSLGDLARYAAGSGSGSWVRVADPETRDLEDTSARGSSSWWLSISQALESTLRASGRKRKGYIPAASFRRAVELAGAHMARAAAIARVSGWQLGFTAEGFGKSVGQYYAELLEQKSQRWVDRVNIKMSEMRGDVWITKPPDPPAVFA